MSEGSQEVDAVMMSLSQHIKPSESNAPFTNHYNRVYEAVARLIEKHDRALSAAKVENDGLKRWVAQVKEALDEACLEPVEVGTVLITEPTSYAGNEIAVDRVAMKGICSQLRNGVDQRIRDLKNHVAALQAEAFRMGQEEMRKDATAKAREHTCGTHPAAKSMCACSDVIGDDIIRLPLKDKP